MALSQTTKTKPKQKEIELPCQERTWENLKRILLSERSLSEKAPDQAMYILSEAESNTVLQPEELSHLADSIQAKQGP